MCTAYLQDLGKFDVYRTNEEEDSTVLKDKEEYICIYLLLKNQAIVAENVVKFDR